MSIDPKEFNWHQFQLKLEQAVAESKNVRELNTKIQTLYNSIPLTKFESKSFDMGELNSLKDKTSLPLTFTIMTHLINQKIKPDEWKALERKFALLQKTYPTEFAQVIEDITKEYSLHSAITTFKELCLGILEIANEQNKYDIVKIINLFETMNFRELKQNFIDLIFLPLKKIVYEKFKNGELIGLRSKPPEIQAKFLEGKSQQITSVKEQYLEQKSYDEIFKDSCSWRSNLAYICFDPDESLFGQLRTTLEDNSPGSGNLASGFMASNAPQVLIEKCEALINEHTDKDQNPVFPSGVQGDLSQRIIYGEIDRQKIPLTRLNRLGHDEASFLKISEDSRDLKSRFPGLWYRHSWTHTEPKYINQCMSHIEDLYQQLLKAKYPDQRLQLIARIHWWGCQACPCSRGSAAIMEVICQGLLEGCNLPFRLDPENPVDIYALTEPNEDQFVKDYVSLLQSTELD
jgi:hypothetical protein